MASTNPGVPILPDYAPVPRASLAPAVNDHGYYVGHVERNLYWVTAGDYHSAFLTTADGVVLFDAPPNIGVVRIGHEETRRLLLRDNDPAKPAPEETFADQRTLEIGSERIELAWYAANPSEDVPGYMAAPAIALSCPWQHLIAGHLGRPGTVDPTPYFGENLWAAVVDVFTTPTVFTILEPIRLDLGFRMDVHS